MKRLSFRYVQLSSWFGAGFIALVLLIAFHLLSRWTVESDEKDKAPPVEKWRSDIFTAKKERRELLGLKRDRLYTLDDSWNYSTDWPKSCEGGKNQSPIDLQNWQESVEHGPIDLDYPRVNGVVFNDKRNFRVILRDNPRVNILGSRYSLHEIRIHAPSEHKIDGIGFDMEVQLIHTDESERGLVLAFFLEEALQENPFLAPLWQEFTRGKNLSALEIERFSLNRLLPIDKSYLSYSGSLTAPPCTEGFEWLVLKTPTRLGGRQLDQFIASFKYNARPVQSVAGRSVHESHNRRLQ